MDGRIVGTITATVALIVFGFVALGLYTALAGVLIAGRIAAIAGAAAGTLADAARSGVTPPSSRAHRDPDSCLCARGTNHRPVCSTRIAQWTRRDAATVATSYRVATNTSFRLAPWAPRRHQPHRRGYGGELHQGPRHHRRFLPRRTRALANRQLDGATSPTRPFTRSIYS